MLLDDTLLAPLFDRFQEPVLLLGKDGRLNYCNPAGRELFPGVTSESPCPPELADLAAREGPLAVCYSKNGINYQLFIATVDQGRLVFFQPTPDAPLSSDNLDRLTEALRQQVAGLSAALQQLEILYREERAEGQVTRWQALLHQNIHRLLRSIGELELSRTLSEGEREVNYRPSPLDLAGFCLGLGREVESLARQAGIDFQLDCQLTSLLTTGDHALLRRMVLELISNAMKASEPGGAVGLRLSATRERALITVWDNGPGMEEGCLASLFQSGSTPFQPQPKQGIGLGLELARRIVTLHGGVILVESRAGQGVTATVSLPICPPRTLPLHTPMPRADFYGGFSPLLVELSDALPWQAFLPEDLEE